MSNFLFNEDISYQIPKDDPIYGFLKDEEESTEPGEIPFSLQSESPSYSSSYYQPSTLNYDELSYGYPIKNCYTPLTIEQNVPESQPLGSNSKKIKREVAKKRAQMKKSSNPKESKDEFDQTEALITEALNNPNLDEKSGKKLKQMIRNRISAQNSRDRKKQYIGNLEKNNKLLKMQNAQLLHELTTLKESNKLFHQETENLKKALQQQKDFCSHCGHSNILSPSQNSSDESIHIPQSDDIDLDRLTLIRENSAHSPTFSRMFGGASRSFFSYTLTFATILSLVLLFNVNNSIDQQTISEIKASKFYMVGPMQNVSIHEKKDNAPIVPLEQAAPISIDTLLSQPMKWPFLQNIETLKTYFNEHAMRSFFNSLKVNEKIAPCIEELDPRKVKEISSMKMEIIEENPMVEYKSFVNYSIQARNELERGVLVPIGGEKTFSNSKTKFSTLFCPAGFQFFDAEDDVMKKGNLRAGSDEVKSNNNVLDTEYIQFYIPRKQVTGVYRDKVTSDLIVAPNSKEINTVDDNVILEVWCKVFQVRELASNM